MKNAWGTLSHVLSLDFQNLRISNTVCSTFWLHSHKDLLDIIGQHFLGRTCHSCPQEWQHLRFPKYGDMLMEKESQTNSWPLRVVSNWEWKIISQGSVWHWDSANAMHQLDSSSFSHQTISNHTTWGRRRRRDKVFPRQPTLQSSSPTT